MSARTTPGIGGETLTVRVSEKTSGVPSGKYFTLTMESIPTPLIAADASAGDVSITQKVFFVCIHNLSLFNEISL